MLVKIDAEALKEKINRQYKNCHGYMGNKREIYREAILAVKSIVHELEQKEGDVIANQSFKN